MKLRTKVFNAKALINHIGLTKRQALEVDTFAQSLNLKSTSIVVQNFENGGYHISTIDSKCWDEEAGTTFGIYNTLMFGPDSKLSINLGAPYRLVKKGMPDTGHALYFISSYSADRMTTLVDQKNSHLLPFLSTKGKGEVGVMRENIPLDAATNGAVPCYFGKTSRGVSKRFMEHMYAVANGSTTRFHSSIRGGDKYQPQIPTVLYINNYVDEEEALDAEEKQIKEACCDETLFCCNVIHSRMALSELLKLFPNEKVPREYAEEMLVAKQERGVENWQDPRYAQSVICNNDRNFDADEVRTIRMLNRLGEPVKVIANKMGVPKNRIDNLILGKTYGRIF